MGEPLALSDVEDLGLKHEILQLHYFRHHLSGLSLTSLNTYSLQAFINGLTCIHDVHQHKGGVLLVWILGMATGRGGVGMGFAIPYPSP